MKYIAVPAALVLTLAGGCGKVGEETLHESCEITSADISNFGFDISQTVSGIINQETGEILFPIPRELKHQFDITKLKVRANVQYDAIIRPSLSGLKDLTEAYPVTVTATMTGKTKNYTLRAYYSRE